jgi:hypothetical protein
VRRPDHPVVNAHLASSHQRRGAPPAKPCPPHAVNHAARVVNYGKPVHRAAGHVA